MAPNENPGQGHEYPPVEVSWLQRDVLLFAVSIGATVDELNFIYELHPKFAAFPTYPIILPFKTTPAEVVDFYGAQSSNRAEIPGVPKLDSKRLVDGERIMTFFKTIPTTSAGRKFESRTKILGVWDKGKPGTVMETQTDLVDAESGEVYTRAVGSAFFVGQGGWGGPKGPKNASFAPPEGVKPDLVHEHVTTPETAHLYRLNGDYNPLHATPEPGKAMGFGGAIMHGLYSWNSTAHNIVRLLGGGDPDSIREFGARFASPVKSGDTLVTQAWRMPNSRDAEGFEEIRFITSVKGGKVCLSNGRAKVRVAASGGASKL